MTGHQVNLRFDEAELDRLKEIAELNNVQGNGKQDPHTKLIRETIRAIHFASATDQIQFLERYAYRRNAKKPCTSKKVDSWTHLITQLEATGLSPEIFERDWLPIIKTIQEIGLDIKGSPDEIYARASRLGAILTVANAVSAKSETVRQSAIKDLMDRAGYKSDDRPELDINRMTEKEVDNELLRLLRKLNLKIVEEENNSVADEVQPISMGYSPT